MTLEIIILVVLFGIALSMDAFAVAVTQGITIIDIDKKKTIFIAFVYGFCQALFPLIGYFITEGLISIFDSTIASNITNIISLVTMIVSSSLLLFIGIKMIVETIRELREEQVNVLKYFKVKDILKMGIITAIDALATGVAFHANISNNLTIFLHVTIIMEITFILTIVAIMLSKQLNKLLKGKPHIASIIGGCILILLAIWIVISHFLELM